MIEGQRKMVEITEIWRPICAVCHILEDEFHVICISVRYTDIINSFIVVYPLPPCIMETTRVVRPGGQ